MTMIQTIDSRDFAQEARQIKRQASLILKKWGLLPRFKRWRLTRDPDTHIVVLSGILNNSYIAMHTSIPFNDYFDPRVLRDLENELHLQVISCNSNDLRYAFILDRGQLGNLPTHIDYPFMDTGRLFFRVAYSDIPVPEVMKPEIVQAVPIAAEKVDDQTLIRQGVTAFLKILEDIKLKDDATLQLSAQNLPDIVVIDEDEFNKRIAENEANRQRINHIRRLMGGNLIGDRLELSEKMQEAMLYAMVHGGKLYRYQGGFWAMENWREGQHPWFGTSTVKALVSRGLMSYAEWQEGRDGRFPIAAFVLDLK
jgi:hypothetical protein